MRLGIFAAVLVLGGTSSAAFASEKLSFSFKEQWRVCRTQGDECATISGDRRNAEVVISTSAVTGETEGRWMRDFRDPGTGVIYRAELVVRPTPMGGESYSVDFSISTEDHAERIRTVRLTTPRWRYLNFADLRGVRTYYSWGSKYVDFGVEVGPAIR